MRKENNRGLSQNRSSKWMLMSQQVITIYRSPGPKGDHTSVSAQTLDATMEPSSTWMMDTGMNLISKFKPTFPMSLSHRQNLEETQLPIYSWDLSWCRAPMRFKLLFHCRSGVIAGIMIMTLLTPCWRYHRLSFNRHNEKIVWTRRFRKCVAYIDQHTFKISKRFQLDSEMYYWLSIMIINLKKLESLFGCIWF